jgi:MATE family multidrug resistance protein
MSIQSIIRSLSVKNDFAPLLKLTLPLVLTGIMQSSLGFFENIFLAHLGPEILAAGALVSWLFATLIVVLFGTFSSVNILISHKHGEKDITGISHVLRDGLMLAIFLTIPTFLLFWNISPVFLLLGQSQKLVTLATSYLHALSWGLFPKFIFIVLYEMLLGLGQTRAITVFTMLSIPFYIFFSYVLIFGKLGLPALGIAGAGWGMTLGDWLATFALSIYILSNKNYRPYLSSLFQFTRPSYLWELLHLGAPMGVMYCVEVSFFLAITLLMGLIGVPSLAANQVTMQYMCILVGVIFSIAQGTTVRMGHQLGAKEVESAERSGYAGILLSTAFMCIIAIFYWSIPETLISIDFNVHAPENSETVHLAKMFFFAAAFLQIAEAIRITLFGALRALKDTRFTLLTSVISFWCIALPIGYVLSLYLTLGGTEFWWGMVIGTSCGAVLLYKRFKSKMHEHLKLYIATNT